MFLVKHIVTLFVPLDNKRLLSNRYLIDVTPGNPWIMSSNLLPPPLLCFTFFVLPFTACSLDSKLPIESAS